MIAANAPQSSIAREGVALVHGVTMRTILAFCRSLFGSLAPATRTWHIEAHQFRSEARTGEEGKPTPEGVHRDVLVGTFAATPGD